MCLTHTLLPPSFEWGDEDKDKDKKLTTFILQKTRLNSLHTDENNIKSRTEQ